VGVLGGYTTFSSYVVDIQRLVDAGAGGIALAYLAATVVAALAAAYAGLVAARWAIRRRGRWAGGREERAVEGDEA
jgi:CrcB protein